MHRATCASRSAPPRRSPSHLWNYRGINPVTQPTPMGHEYCAIVEEVGRAVTKVKPGLLGVLSAKLRGAARVIAMSRHESRQKLAREFGATDIVTARGDEGVARIKGLTNGIGADAVLECVGTQESMMQACRKSRAAILAQLTLMTTLARA
jgi:threonine dehydrogenase-like Zn-dependent dehydrogenase